MHIFTKYKGCNEWGFAFTINSDEKWLLDNEYEEYEKIAEIFRIELQ